ncbi:membrane fusion protein, Cu(I)/Ag(I) efflux system [Cyclonatronum proteinivorum]|uniref:Membrane fusion protein, Cu(I)/Ag(I) efflux system n=1 Tax=Cyclonatronum proteinivorum TaxID=1457365 RepID=A0A345UGE0_9BACT|nr:efflux RND transporter periplasmic adaptor subunit [Cyclonatronum proteinivorum]AXI99541.1 membrane fusion protein, Cu(I)/Ag(I) efflux system [Cyclonatronum proteinivorum]
MEWNKKTLLLLSAVLVTGVFLGWLLFGGSHGDHNGHAHVHHDHAHNHDHANGEEAGEETIWTCSMHPAIREDQFGLCPICAMDLIPASADDGGDFELSMSEAAVHLAGIRTTEVMLAQPVRELRLPGRVVPDERRLHRLSAHFPGRITYLRTTETGAQINRGDLIARVYAPELVSAQQELLEAKRLEAQHPELLRAARARLLQWEISESQIDAILESGSVRQELEIFAPVSGILMRRNVEQGAYVSQGTVLLELADLSRVWLRFEAWEEDLGWLRTGTEVTFSTRSQPGREHRAVVTFIDPLVDAATRTAGVRAEMANADGALRPGQLLTGTLRVTQSEAALMVPASAVMWTGPRSVVFVEDTDAETPRFESREVTLGKRAGDFFVIEDGLEAGERVVFSGAFKLDSAFQLADRFSMMNRGPGLQPVRQGHGDHAEVRRFRDVPEAFRLSLTQLTRSYLEGKEAYVESDFTGSVRAFETFQQQLQETERAQLPADMVHTWRQLWRTLDAHVNLLLAAGDIEEGRAQFRHLSDGMVEAVRRFGVEGVVYHQYCPMAFNDEGGHWLSAEEPIMNPYLPEIMLMCGDVIARIE